MHEKILKRCDCNHGSCVYRGQRRSGSADSGEQRARRDTGHQAARREIDADSGGKIHHRHCCETGGRRAHHRKQKGSYAVGLNIGAGLKQQPVDLDLAALFKGITDGRNGTKPLLTDDQVTAALKQLRDQA